MVRLKTETLMRFKKVKAVVTSSGKPSRNYEVSLDVWDHTMLLATRHKRTHPAINPSQ